MGKNDGNNRVELKKIVELCELNNLKIKTFLEIGSKDGDDAQFIMNDLSLKEDDIYILEAHPLFYKEICKKYPNFNCYNYAAWNENKEIFFNAAKNMDDGRSSIMFREDYGDDFSQVKIDAKRIDYLIENYIKKQIDCCKIDVEGATLEVLKGFGEHLQDVKLLQIEAEQKVIWEKQNTFVEVYEFLYNNGFKKVWEIKLGSTQLDSIWIKK